MIHVSIIKEVKKGEFVYLLVYADDMLITSQDSNWDEKVEVTT